MIKKAVLTLTLTPFFMVFSDHSFAQLTPESKIYDVQLDSSWERLSGSFCSESNNNSSCMSSTTSRISDFRSSGNAVTVKCKPSEYIEGYTCYAYYKEVSELTDYDYSLPLDNVPFDDERCQASNGSSYSTNNIGIYNYLSTGGAVNTNNGACSVTAGGGVTACTGSDDNISCSIPIESASTGEISKLGGNIPGGLNSQGTFSVVNFNTPEYLNELPGGCSDPSSCVTIGDTSYLVDWDSAPDYFSYVDSNGNTHSKPSSGGGGDTGGGDNGGGDPTDPTDPTDPGGDNGGDTGGGDDSDDDNDSGGGSGGGSTVPEFEFDESGIIEAIGSAGRSNRNAINALSNDVTGAISNQTDDLNTATTAQTDSLNSSLDDQTDDLTGAINDQTDTLTGSLDALGTTFTDALKGLGLGSIGDDTGDGDGDGDGDGEGDGEGDGLLGGISKLLNRLVDKLASTFTEDLGDGDDLFDASGMDETLDGVAAQEQQHTGEVNALMDEIGDGATSGIAEQITSRLPSLPSGGCVPLQFGPMEISCQAFNTIKLWLTWIIYFWTVVSIVDTFFRSDQRTA